MASVGRAELLGRTVARLKQQSRPPDGVIVVGSAPADVEGLDTIAAGLPLEIILTTKGLPIQRNAGLDAVGDSADVICFFDDDFLPAFDYLARVQALFQLRGDLVGVTGRLIADGIKSPGITFEAAEALIVRDHGRVARPDLVLPALYGCNFAFRGAAVRDIRFDESLPLYGWQEDVDFSYRLGQRGLLIRSDVLAGVHMGTKGGRTSGKRLGYSQIANPIYLLRKRSIPPRLAWRLMVKNVAANAVRSLRPEPYIDRGGRLKGNLIAVGDLLRGTIHPMRILTL